MKNKNIIIIGTVLLVLIVGIVSAILILNKDKEPTEITDGEKFSEEYTEVDKENVFVYRDINEIIKILENGTGLVYLGFPECPWCQTYVKYLNEVAEDMAVSKIYYYDILEARKDNTKEYQQIVSLLEDYLQYDEEGNKRVYVPSVIAVEKGEIVGFDDETAWDTKGFEIPQDYWTENEVKDLKEKLETMIGDAGLNICNDCNS